jgi:hypothetical protein
VLVARVFRQKLTVFLKTIQQWDGGCAYFFCTVEFQHRGLPHAHIALRVKQPPSFSNDMEHIQTDMPEPTEDRYRQLVGTHMIHGCTRKFADERTGVKEVFACRRHKTKKNVVLKKCTRGYPKPYVSRAYTSDTGYPVYARQAPSDLHDTTEHVDPVAARTKASIMKAWPDMTWDEICRRVSAFSQRLKSGTAGVHIIFASWSFSIGDCHTPISLSVLTPRPR